MMGKSWSPLRELLGRVGAGRTRPADADQFLQPSLLRASPETPSCFALRLSQSLASSDIIHLTSGSAC